MYKMRFSGQAFCQKDKKVKKWVKGDVVDGSFEGLLPNTYVFGYQTTLKKPDKKPITKKRLSSRDFTVKQAKEMLEGMNEAEKALFLDGETRKSL